MYAVVQIHVRLHHYLDDLIDDDGPQDNEKSNTSLSKKLLHQ
jgi:hypothetical protein